MKIFSHQWMEHKEIKKKNMCDIFTHTHMHARMHTHTHAHIHTQTCIPECVFYSPCRPTINKNCVCVFVYVSVCVCVSECVLVQQSFFSFCMLIYLIQL